MNRLEQKIARGTARVGVLGALVLAAMALGGRPASAATARAGASSATLPVTVGTATGAVIPSGFVGLSFEAPTISSSAITAAGSHLPALLHTLGRGRLRFAGDSVDHTQWRPTPAAAQPWAAATITPTDLRNVGALARTTGWQVLLGLNLGHPDAAAVADETRSATTILGPALAGVEIGNEPDLYTRPVPIPFRSVLGSHALRDHTWGFSTYSGQFTNLRRAVFGAAPGASLYGPATASTKWLPAFAAQQTPGLAALSVHYYPFDRCRFGRILRHGPSIGSLLARHAGQRELREISAAVAAGASRGVPLRVDEANSVACGGQPNVSDTFASALWAVDFGLLAARSGAAGVDFHGGLGSCQRMGTLSSPWYSPLCGDAAGRLHARPEYYGLALLSALEGDAFVPVTYHTANDVTVYALHAPDGSLRVVIDDMDTPATPSARQPTALTVALQAGARYRRAAVLRMTAPSVGAKHAITLGGASVAADGTLAAPVSAPVAGASGTFRIPVTPGSASLVTLAP